jgi:23S rRNA (cytosine1962-C5)-methyltransferase
MLTPQNWKDYELLDSGDGMKLERWKDIVLARPDPQAIWPKALADSVWRMADGIYTRSDTGGGSWHFNKQLPERWEIKYGDLKFLIRPTDFKHTGLFPEQAVNWDWLKLKIVNCKLKIKVLNLFAYTGAATAACAAAGASVVHVDSSKGIVEWAKENLELSGLKDAPVRFIVDDAMKFAAREKRRGHTYDGIIMDPPSFGHGAKGETWKIEKMLYPLVSSCAEILSPQPLFFLINSYTTGLSPIVLENILRSAFATQTSIESGELGLKQTSNGFVLPAGGFARWSK